MTVFRPATFRTIAETALDNALSKAPVNQFVIWNGVRYTAKLGSTPDHVFQLIKRPWNPVAVRELLTLAARISGDAGLHPDRVRNAVRSHQDCGNTCYFLTQRNRDGDFIAVADVPRPSAGPRLQQGDVVMRRSEGDGLAEPLRMRFLA